jgi:hypothetical protein
MAYLKDLNDLGLSQQPNPISPYGASAEDAPIPRSRRPTESGREIPMVMNNSTQGLSGQLRSMSSMTGLRAEIPNQTLSVITTDSIGSNDERKFKDDKGKRVMVVQEIIK